jgi:hypothetical protein
MKNFGQGMWRRVSDYDRLYVQNVNKVNINTQKKQIMGRCRRYESHAEAIMEKDMPTNNEPIIVSNMLISDVNNETVMETNMETNMEPNMVPNMVPNMLTSDVNNETIMVPNNDDLYKENSIQKVENVEEVSKKKRKKNKNKV